MKHLKIKQKPPALILKLCRVNSSIGDKEDSTKKN